MRNWRKPSDNSLDELYGIILGDEVMSIGEEEDGLKWIYVVINIDPETNYFLCKRKDNKKVKLMNISQFKFHNNGNIRN
jgi:hypothetical protein